MWCVCVYIYKNTIRLYRQSVIIDNENLRTNECYKTAWDYTKFRGTGFDDGKLTDSTKNIEHRPRQKQFCDVTSHSPIWNRDAFPALLIVLFAFSLYQNREQIISWRMNDETYQ
jgi:hypothetical protein